MQQVTIPWGEEELTIPLPDEWKLQEVAVPSSKPPSQQWHVRMAESLMKPVTGASLAERLDELGSGRICIIVEDMTRNSPLHDILQILLDELRHAGINNEQIEFFIACGMHPHPTAEQIASKLGPAADGIAWVANPWQDETQYSYLGRIGRTDIRICKRIIEADLRIILSSVSPHLQAGFGGGYKMMFPGCGELKSIRMLHRHGVDGENIGQLVGMDVDKNPMRQVIDKAGVMVDQTNGSTFTIQFMLDSNDLPTHIASGDPLPAHRMLTKKCAIEYGIVSEEPADILITNAHPRDYDLWQTFKCIPNTCWAARKGGIVICMGRCEQGLNEMKTMPWPINPRWTRKLVKFLGPARITSMLDRIVAGIAGDSRWFIQLATSILKRNTIYMVSPALHENEVKFPGIAIYPNIEKALKAAGKRLGKGSHRVAVYPVGGASFPIISWKHLPGRK